MERKENIMEAKIWNLQENCGTKWIDWSQEQTTDARGSNNLGTVKTV